MKRTSLFDDLEDDKSSKSSIFDDDLSDHLERSRRRESSYYGRSSYYDYDDRGYYDTSYYKDIKRSSSRFSSEWAGYGWSQRIISRTEVDESCTVSILPEYEELSTIRAAEKSIGKYGKERKTCNYMIKDIYRSYKDPNYKILLNDEQSNYWWYRTLNKLSSGPIKHITNRNPYLSETLTAAIAEKLEKTFEDKCDENGNLTDKAKKDLENGKYDAILAGIVQEAMGSLKETIEDNRKARKGNAAGKTTLKESTIQTFNERTKRVPKRKLNKLVQDTVKSFKGYFGKASKPIIESFLDSEDIRDIVDLEFLSLPDPTPHLEDIYTQEPSKCLKLDIFVDCSGSMSSGFSGISNSVFAQSIVYNLYTEGVLNSLYMFEDKVYYKELNRYLSESNHNGGTSIDCVVQHVMKSDNPSVCVTDGEDTINYYTNKLYFVMIISYNSAVNYCNNAANMSDENLNSDHISKINKFIKNDQVLFYTEEGVFTRRELV